MAVVYVKEAGAAIRKNGERIAVTKNGQTLLEIPMLYLDNLALIGNVQLTTQAMHMLLEKGIDISYFSRNGKYVGQTAADSSKNIFLRFEQYQFYMDINRRLEMAKKIVANKIRNQIALIRHFRWDNTEYDWKADVRSLERHLKEIEAKENPNQVLGVEGICANIYFRAFGRMLKCDFTFSGRNRRPPRDPVNIILSLTYTFLTKEICSSLEAESFEPYLGFLHGIRYGRKSLALDIIEEFRQPVADRFVIFVFNKRIFGKYDFEDSEDMISLNEDGFKKFCSEYERWMNGKNSVSGEGSFRKVIHRQIASLKKCIMKREEYQPYAWKEEISGEL